jgi:hypothetical protein
MANVLVFTELHDGHVKPVTLEILGKLAGQTADVAVIGDTDCWLPVGGRCGHHIGHPRRSVEHRELGVEMQMGE